MIGLLLVSHSASLAAATEALVRQMTGEKLRLALAAGSGPDGNELGTDTSAILAKMEALRDCDAIVVLMDIGSAVLSAEMARDLADDALRGKIRLSSAPFVEGAVAAGVAAASGLPVARVLAEAASGLSQKQSGLGGAQVAKTRRAGAAIRHAVIADPHGLHLRPAAAFVNLATRFDAEILLRCGVHAARGDSLTALMAAGAGGGAAVTIEASGRDADAAADALSKLLERPPGEALKAVPITLQSGPSPLSPGTAAGRLFVAERRRAVIPDAPAPDRDAARERLDAAVASARAALAGSPILEAQAALLTDPAILGLARDRIVLDGRNECAAWQLAIDEAAAGYTELEAPYLRDRARDVREAGDAVLRILLGAAWAGIEWPAQDVVALVEDLTAAEAASLPLNVLGVLDTAGSTSSHAAILLRAAGIPALGNVALERIPQTIAFDGATGAITLDPDPAAMAGMGCGQNIAAGPGVIRLPDGTTLELWANVSGERDATAAARAGAYGIGLMRTEILFLGRADVPSEDEQAARFAAVLAPFKGRPVVVRVLDAGTDKPVPFLHLAPEINPALGVRGIRALLNHKDFFAAHLRAILRAGVGHDLRIMVPMVAVPEEMRAVRELLTGICAAQATQIPLLGAMIEVPAAAIRVQDLVEISDFFSIGTNDLTQYVFAAERGNRDLNALVDASHAAILDLCAGIVARAGGRPVSVCGEAAGDLRTARLLVKSGIRRLSMGAARLDGIRGIAAEKANP
jgi:phosphocarrier protein FPr